MIIKFRCTFLGDVSSKEVQSSSFLEAMRVPLKTCKRKRESNNGVCCRNKKKKLQKLIITEKDYEDDYVYYDEQDLDYDLYEGDYFYEELEDGEYVYEDFDELENGDYFYEDIDDNNEDYDMNFDKITVFSHVNAPGGR